MKLSQTGFETAKITNLNEMYPAQDLLMQTCQLSQFASGIFAYNNIPLRVMRKIENVIRTVLDKHGCTEICLPVMQPESLWQQSGRWEKYIADGTMLVIKTDKGSYGLAPTAEEAVVNFAKGQLKSYKNLPVTFYQIGDKYRNEIRNRGFLMRGKAFVMMDAYSFDVSEKNSVNSYENLRQAYLEIFKNLEIEIIAVAADSGAIGGNKSEEFMMLSDAGEDRILIDKKTGKGFNAEILERKDYAQYLAQEYGISDLTRLEEKRAIELGHIFQLGKKYSESMNATFRNAQDKPEFFWMGCYGIGVSRTLAAIYEKNVLKDVNGKLVGIALPPSVAPYLVQIIYKDTPEKSAAANELYQLLKSQGIECILDDRENISIGAKIQDTKKLGTPYMIILGDKTKPGEFELEQLSTGAKTTLGKSELIKKFNLGGNNGNNIVF